VIVLDTHALLWWVEQGSGKLGSEARRRIASERRAGEIIVSSITAWEMALLIAKQRLGLAAELESWLSKVARIDRLRFAPVDNAIAIAAVNLPGPIHRDPADRIILATARHFNAALVTADRQLHAYPHVNTIW
jgi:PIN domain nuclease of toxin-antitoxin system